MGGGGGGVPSSLFRGFTSLWMVQDSSSPQEEGSSQLPKHLVNKNSFASEFREINCGQQCNLDGHKLLQSIKLYKMFVLHVYTVRTITA